ncbi:galactosylceramide sulfotransferase-like [Macrobrachium rosenbergii]|uniref:galactosylceramide sulfotransferase-like n=1 Tax=Macrobrachium rosenbergii TaxID=79674 RepID=UPI0034D5D3C6
MARRKEQRKRVKESGNPSVLAKLLLLLCVVSTMALVLQLNLATQQNAMLRNIKGAEEPRLWIATPAAKFCRPRRHLVFLKTHKCGSSTVQNVFLRYAFNHNLSVALPYSGVNLDGNGETLSSKVKELKDSPFAPPIGKYHFLIHHTRLNVKAVQQLTYDDSVWVTILREPSAVFESMFHYFHMHKFYGSTFDHLVWQLEGHSGVKSRLKHSSTRYLGRLGKNQMTWDLGLDDSDLRQDSVLREAFRILDENFHLVMLAERMDESLVLLRHLMCWNEDDVVVLAQNVRKDRYRSYMAEHTVTTLEHFNSVDVKLYSYFKERFDKQVQGFGIKRMEEEVARLRESRDKVWKLCGVRDSLNKKKPIVAKGSKDENDEKHHLVIQYQVHNNGTYKHRRACKDLIRPGVEFTQILRWKQYARYHYMVSNSYNLSWTPNSSKRKPKKKGRKPPRPSGARKSSGQSGADKETANQEQNSSSKEKNQNDSSNKEKQSQEQIAVNQER